MGKMRKFLSLLTAAAVVLSLVCAALYLFHSNFVIISGGLHRRDVRELDLRGAPLSRIENIPRCPDLQSVDLRGTGLTVQQYTWLKEQLPDCTVLWDVPFQGRFLSQDAENLTLTGLTAEEVDLLDHLPRLLYIDALNCEEYELLQLLQQRHPDCHIVYSVTVGNTEWDCRETSLSLENADTGELAQRLAYLPMVEQIQLTGNLPPMAELVALQEQYPLIRICWETALGGATLSSEITSLDLRGTTLESLQQVENALQYYPALTHADMRDCGLSDEDMMTLADRHPEITFLWNMEVAGVRIPTDAAEIDISGNYVEDISQVEAVLPYFPNLRKVVMCGCGIDNETMAAVNSRYEQIRFVWSVYMGTVLLRTDATYFIPVKWGAQVTTEDLYNLRYCTDLLCVDIGHMEVTSCEWAAYMPKLKYLLLADTGISDLTPLKDLKNLIYLEIFLTRVTDLSPLTGCTALQDLNLCYTYGDPSPLLQMPWLQNVWWSGHWAAGYSAHLFRQMNPDIRLEFDTASSTGNGWRELKNYYDMRDLVGMGYMTG